MRESSFALVTFAAMALFSLAPPGASGQSTAFFYGPTLPEELLATYDRVVVEPDHGFDPSARGQGAELVAYLSVGEVAESSPERARIAKEWVLATNPAWNSLVMDLAAPAYRLYLVERRFEALWSRGYRSFFLDTLDSYQLAAKTDAERARQRAGLVALIEALRVRRPEAKLLLNRGFELLDRVAGHVSAVVAESLFASWDAGARRYLETTEDARSWLRARLDEVRRRGIPVIVIDYVPPGDRQRARAVARRIQALGYQPWVSDAALGSLGVGDEEVLPRRVLVLTNEAHIAGRPAEGLAMVAPVLEQLGLVAAHHDLSVGLPRVVPGTLRGIVTWLSSERVPDGYGAFLRVQIAEGVKLAMFGITGLPPGSEEARALGLSREQLPERAQGAALRVVARDAVARFEAEPVPSLLELAPVRASGWSVVEHLGLEASGGRRYQAVVSTAWGGLASSHYLAPRGLHGERAWVVDPYAFLTRTLGLDAVPRPDLTTEHGERLALFTIRAEGLAAASRHPGRPQNLSLLEALLARFPVPHALDLESSRHNAPSGADLALASRLGGRPYLVKAAPPPGSTLLTREQPFVTRIAPLALESGAHASGPALPMAGDYHFVPEGMAEAYPYHRAAETIALTDAPRRLLPVALDYHVTSLASDGGFRAIERLYEQLFAAGTQPTSYAEHTARVRAFGEQVITRGLDGVYRFRGGAPLRTVRLDPALGGVDLARSRGVASLRTLPQGTYVTFLPRGERSLALSSTPAPLAHLSRVNGEVRSFSRGGDGVLRFELSAYLPLEFELSALPAGASCRLSGARGRWARKVSSEGVLRFAPKGVRAGSFVLTCTGREGP